MLFAGGIAGTSISLVALAPWMAGLWIVDNGKLSDSTAQTLFLTCYAAFGVAAVGIVVALVGYWVGTRRTTVMPGWTGWLALATALLALVGIVMQSNQSVGFVSYMLMLLWGLLVSIVALTRKSA